MLDCRDIMPLAECPDLRRRLVKECLLRSCWPPNMLLPLEECHGDLLNRAEQLSSGVTQAFQQGRAFPYLRMLFLTLL